MGMQKAVLLKLQVFTGDKPCGLQIVRKNKSDFYRLNRKKAYQVDGVMRASYTDEEEHHQPNH